MDGFLLLYRTSWDIVRQISGNNFDRVAIAGRAPARAFQLTSSFHNGKAAYELEANLEQYFCSSNGSLIAESGIGQA